MIREERIKDRENIFRLMMESNQANLWTSLPGICSAVDLAAQTCTVQPAIKIKQTLPDGSIKDVNLPLCIHVPIVFQRAGGFALTLPVSVGDECLISFSCRCIDQWWQSGEVSQQAEIRMNDLSDGFAFFGPTSQAKKLSNVSEDTAQLRTEDGLTYIEITSDGKVNIVAATTINVVAPVINAVGNITHLSGIFTSSIAVNETTHRHNKNGIALYTLGPENAA